MCLFFQIPLFKRLSSSSSQSVHFQSAVGVSVSFEMIVSAMQQDDGAVDMVRIIICYCLCVYSSCSYILNQVLL